jgi:hypothetical protein
MNWMSVRWSTLRDFLDARGLSAQYVEDDNFYYIKAADGYFGLETVISKTSDFEAADKAEWEDDYKAYGNQSPKTNTVIESTPPFAQPTYRTKRNATSSLITIAANSHEHVDFRLTAERYVSGGCIIVDGAEFGDYAEAEVVDADSVIPEAYRAALCENWPTVAKYIEKEWIEVNKGGITRHKIDTYPLNAKITAGLYLRVTYYTTSTGSSRSVGVNYYLTKKL